MYGYLVWLLSTLFVVYSFCLNTAAAVFAGAIQKSLHITPLSVSLAMGAFILGFAIMQIPAGYLLDKFNARYIVSVGVFLLAVGNLLTSIAPNFYLFTLSNFLQGLGASFAFVSAAVLISEWFSLKSFPILFGLTQTLSCILASIIHYYFTLALTTYTWHKLYYFLSLFGFGLFVLMILFVKSGEGKSQTQSLSILQSLQIILKNKQIWLCSISAATSFGVLLAYASFWYTAVQKFYSVQTLDSVTISGMIFIGIGVGTPILGWLSNLWHSRVLIIHLSLTLGTMALLLVLYLPHFNIYHLIIIKMISFIMGFLLSGAMLYYTMISEITNIQVRGVAVSFLNTAVFLFNTLMLFIPYLFITKFSTNFFTYLWILPFFTIFAALLNYFIKDSYKNEGE
jgi:MFS family permease